MKGLFCPIPIHLSYLSCVVPLVPKDFPQSDDRDVSRLGLKQEERYVWQGGQNHDNRKTEHNPATDHPLDDRATTACPVSAIDRTGIWRHVQWSDQQQHRFEAKADRAVEVTLEAVVQRAGGHRVSRIASRTSPRHRRCSG